LNIIERFSSKYDIDALTDCWTWSGALNTNNWPVFSVNGKPKMAHRYSYEHFVGPIPPGSNVSRWCMNIKCVNPEHAILLSRNPIERFWSKIKKTDTCWVWEPHSFVYRVGQKNFGPRYYAYVLERGEPESSLSALCGNKKCVNPSHAGTKKDRFWAKVQKDSDGCWNWMGSKTINGYAHLNYGGKTVYASRLAYEWANGDISPEYKLKHTCKNRACVNPEHLEPVIKI